MNRMIVISGLFFLVILTPCFAQEKPHKDHSEEKHDSHEKEADHADHVDADDHKTEEHGVSANDQVGIGKGIVEANEVSGFKLSPEAEKNFEIKKINVSSQVVEIPNGAIVTAVNEINIFRYRSGFYRRIDFDFVSKGRGKTQIKSKDLKVGDEIIISGLGFLRLAEIAAFGGAPEGHSH